MCHLRTRALVWVGTLALAVAVVHGMDAGDRVTRPFIFSFDSISNPNSGQDRLYSSGVEQFMSAFDTGGCRVLDAEEVTSELMGAVLDMVDDSTYTLSNAESDQEHSRPELRVCHTHYGSVGPRVVLSALVHKKTGVMKRSSITKLLQVVFLVSSSEVLAAGNKLIMSRAGMRLTYPNDARASLKKVRHNADVSIHNNPKSKYNVQLIGLTLKSSQGATAVASAINRELDGVAEAHRKAAVVIARRMIEVCTEAAGTDRPCDRGLGVRTAPSSTQMEKIIQPISSLVSDPASTTYIQIVDQDLDMYGLMWKNVVQYSRINIFFQVKLGQNYAEAVKSVDATPQLFTFDSFHWNEMVQKDGGFLREQSDILRTLTKIANPATPEPFNSFLIGCNAFYPMPLADMIGKSSLDKLSPQDAMAVGRSISRLWPAVINALYAAPAEDMGADWMTLQNGEVHTGNFGDEPSSDDWAGFGSETPGALSSDSEPSDSNTPKGDNEEEDSADNWDEDSSDTKPSAALLDSYPLKNRVVPPPRRPPTRVARNPPPLPANLPADLVDGGVGNARLAVPPRPSAEAIAQMRANAEARRGERELPRGDLDIADEDVMVRPSQAQRFRAELDRKLMSKPAASTGENEY